MKPKISLDMLKDAGTGAFPVIDLGAYMADEPGAIEKVATAPAA
jgi:hypothetical protein